MSSPVINLENLEVSKSDKKPLYMRVADALEKWIYAQHFDKTMRLPGSRKIAEQLQIHRKTVVAATEELSHRGIIDIIANRGMYCKPSSNQTHFQTRQFQLQKETNFPFYHNQKLNALENNTNINADHLYITAGSVDHRLYPMTLIARQLSSTWRRSINQSFLISNQSTGNPHLKQQFEGYFLRNKNIHIHPENIFISDNLDESLFIVANTICQKGDYIIIPAPFHHRLHLHFQQIGVKILTVSMTANGLNLLQLEKYCHKFPIKAILQTAMYHFPTTIQSSETNLSSILQIAEKYQVAIIEINLESDFTTMHYPSRHLLMGQDYKGQVIYIDHFSQQFAPSLATGCIIAPTDLLSEFIKYKQIYNAHFDLIKEQTLADWLSIKEGERQLKKTQKIYQERNHQALELLQILFQEQLEITVSPLALWISFQSTINLRQLQKNASQLGLQIPDYCLFQNKELNAIRLGIVHLNEIEIIKGMQILKQAFILSKKEA